MVLSNKNDSNSVDSMVQFCRVPCVLDEKEIFKLKSHSHKQGYYIHYINNGKNYHYIMLTLYLVITYPPVKKLDNII